MKKGGKCYTFWNMVFDESSSWWYSKKEILPDSNVFRDKLQFAQIQLSLGESEDTTDSDSEMTKLKILGKLVCMNNQAKKVSLVK